MRQDRRQAEREFVNHQDLGVLHQAAAQSQHLLLAAGEGRRLLFAALFQPREQLIDAIQVRLLLLAGTLGVSAHLQVFFHGHVREELAALRDQHQAAVGFGVRGEPGHVFSVQQDTAFPGTDAAHGGAQGGGLASAIGADDGGHLPQRHVDRDAPQHLHLAVAGLHVLQSQGKVHQFVLDSLSTISGNPR